MKLKWCVEIRITFAKCRNMMDILTYQMFFPYGALKSE